MAEIVLDGSLDGKPEDKKEPEQTPQTESVPVAPEDDGYKRPFGDGIAKFVKALDIPGHIRAAVQSAVIPAVFDISDSIYKTVTDSISDSMYSAFGLQAPRRSTYTSHRYIDYTRPGATRTGGTPVTAARGMRDELSGIRFATWTDATEVRDAISRKTITTHEATVGDFKRAAGMSASYTDERWGWHKFENVFPRRLGDYYIIPVPEVVSLT